MKYAQETGTAKGSFERFAVQDEIVLTALQLGGIGPADEVRIAIEVGWDNSGAWDMGELEIMLRKDSPAGEIVEWSLESCFASALTKLQYKTVGGHRTQIYYLTVRSPQGRAVICGPYWLRGGVRRTS
ncbi:hypothetical protein [Cohnella sp. JJ-181]|uniref:hypothetical protein n=1 Tax=Cohnella rhizoplanae TaxID=2974897 RepID=UPI0022FF519F|nr:hypothetical protein [Cohnella sp. JJ-181]CAI6032588.1 hypothetical protein COHCIP112018_00763 [Cohnella sp. JJ-181]